MTSDFRPYILIAEDDWIAQKFFEEILSNLYEVNVVENGQYFFEAFHERAPELVILDINMPILDGIETCRLLRDYEQYEDIPIILASAQATQEVVDECGATDFIVKPFNEQQLLQLVDNYLHK